MPMGRAPIFPLKSMVIVNKAFIKLRIPSICEPPSRKTPSLFPGWSDKKLVEFLDHGFTEDANGPSRQRNELANRPSIRAAG
jgi:hypothetical protein